MIFDPVTYRRAASVVLGRDDIQIVVAGGALDILTEAGAPALPALDQNTLDAIDAKVLEMTMAETIASAVAAVSHRADQLGSVIAGLAPSFEKHSWSDKRQAALKVKEVIAAGGTPSPADDDRIVMLLAECSVSGESLETLADKVLANVDVAQAANYWAAVGLIAGQRRVTQAAIKQLTNPATVEADIANILAAAEANAQALLQSLLSA